MCRIKITQEIEVYEVDGVEVGAGKTVKLKVLSHWNRHQLVAIGIGEKKYTVVGNDLITAIRNAMNTGDK